LDRTRRNRIVALVTAVGLALALLIGTLWGRCGRWEYVAEESAAGGWGDAAAEFGSWRGLDGRLQGPRSFAVDETGNIWIADTCHARIVLRPANGAPPVTVPIEAGGARLLPVDIAVAGDVLYILADAAGSGGCWQLLRLSPAGTGGELTVVPSPPEVGDWWAPERIFVDRQGNLHLELSSYDETTYRQMIWVWPQGQEQWQPLAGLSFAADGSVGPVDANLLPAGLGCLARLSDGYAFLRPPGGRSGVDPTTVEVLSATDTGEERLLFAAEAPAALRDVAICGVDAADALYLGYNLGPRGGGAIIKYRRDGSRVHAWDVPGDQAAAVGVRARVTPTGDVYLATAVPEGYRIDVWRHRRVFGGACGRPGGGR